MALDPKDAKELRDMLKEIEQLSIKLKANINTTSLQNVEANADTIKRLFKDLKEEWNEINRETQSFAQTISDTVREIRKTESGANNIAKSFRVIDSVADDILSHQKGIYQMSADDADLAVVKLKYGKKRLEDLQKQYKLEEEFLEKKKKENDDLEDKLKTEIEDLEKKNKLNKEEEKLLKEKKGLLNEVVDKNSNIPKLLIENKDAHEQVNKLLGEENHKYRTLVDYAKQIRTEQENLEKAIGITGAALDGISAGFEKIGLGSLADRIGLDKAKNRMKEFTHYITDGGKKTAGLIGQFRILSVGIGSLGKSIMKNLTDPLVMAGLAAKGVQKGVGLIKFGFSSVLGFVKNLWGMADSFAAVFEKYAKAGQFAAQNFSAVGGQVNALTAGLNAAAAADPFMRVAEAGPALKAIVDGTGVMQTQMAGSVKEAHDLTYWLGYSAEETGKLFKLGALNNQSAKESLIDIRSRGVLLNKEHKTAIDLRKVEQTALKASAAVTYNLRQNPKAIADAAFHATKLNMTLDEIASAAEQTLNFESSIQDQLTYQAMSGKEINIDAYQQAALRGDTVTSAKELNNLIAKHGPGLKNNVLLQEAFAKSVGIGKDKLLEAMTATDVARQLGEDRNYVEKQLQALQRKGLTLEEASVELSKEGLSGSLAKSKRAEAMSRSLEDFRDYMATKLWPLFKAVFSPANIKMFMSVISGMRPVFVELGKAITAFFSPKSAGAMTDIIKNDVMPAILDMAKMLTEVAGVAGEALFGVIKALGPIIKKDIIPIFKMLGGIIRDLAPTVGVLIKAFAGGLAKVFGKIGEHKEDIKSFIETLAKGLTNVFGFVANHLKEIAITLIAFKGLTAVRSLKSAIMGSPGSSAMSPMYVKNVGVSGGEGGLFDKIKGFFGKGSAAATTTATTTAAATTAATTGGAAAPLASTVSKTAAASPPPPPATSTGGKFYKGGQMLPGGGRAPKGGITVPSAGGATSPLTQTAAPTSFADKRKMVAARQAAGGGLSSKAASTTSGAAGAGGKLASTGTSVASNAGGAAGAGGAGVSNTGKFGQMAGGMLKGAAALIVLAGALYIAAKAFQEFAKVEWESVAKGILVLGGLVGAAYLLGKIKKPVMEGAAAIGILAASLYIAAKSIQEFAKVNLENMGKAGIALLGLTGALKLVSKSSGDLIKGGAAVALLAASLYIAAKGIQEFAEVNIGDMVTAGSALLGLTAILRIISKSSGDLIKAGAAMALVAASLYIAAKGIQEFSMVEPEDMEKAGVALLGLGVSIIGLSKLMGKASGDLIKAGAAMALMSASLYITAKAVKEFDGIKWEDMGKAGAALLGLSVAALILGKAGPTVLVGSAAMLVMAGALYVVALAVDKFAAVKWEDMGKAGAALVVLTGAVIGLGAAMMSGIGALAILAGVAAMVAMGGALYVVAEGISALQNAVGGGKLDTLGADLNKGLTAITVGLNNVDFDDLENKFEGLQSALDVLDLDSILAFAELAKADLGKAASNLMEGMKNLTTLTPEGGGEAPDFNKFTSELITKLKPLQGVNQAFTAALQGLNVTKLVELSKVSGSGLVNAIKGIAQAIKEITTFDFAADIDNWFDPNDLESKLQGFIWVFSNFNSAISTLNFEKLKEFGESAKFQLSEAATNLLNGVNTMAGLEKPVSKISEEVKASFRTFGQIISSLDTKSLVEFASLANSNFELATAKFINGVNYIAEHLGAAAKTEGENIKKAFTAFNESIGGLNVEKSNMPGGSDGLLAFAKLAEADLSGAAVNLVKGMDQLQVAFKNADDSIKSYTFPGVKEAFTALNNVLTGIDLEAFTKLADLGDKAVNMGDGATNIRKGLDAINIAFDGYDEKKATELKNKLEPVFNKLSEIFGGTSKFGEVLTSLGNLAKAEFSKLGSAVIDFKNGLNKLVELDKIDITPFAENGNIDKLFESLSKIFNVETGPLNIDTLIKFGEADFSKMTTSVGGLKKGLAALQELTTAFTKIVDGQTQADDFSGIKTLLDNVSKAFAGENITALISFAEKNFSSLPGSARSLGEGIAALLTITSGQKSTYDALQQDFLALSLAVSSLNLTSLGEISNAAPLFKKLGTAFINLKTALGSFAGLNIAQEIAQLKELSNIDASKLVTLSEAIIKLSDSFVVLAKAIKEMGDITPVVKISDQMLKLHESVSKNPMNAEKLAEGVGAIFSGLMGSLVSFVEGGGQGVSNSFFGGVTKGKDGIVQAQDGELNPNGGPVVSTFQKGQLTPVMQGIKEDNVYLTTNKPISSSTGNYDALFAKMEQFISVMEANKDKPIVIENNTTLSVDGDKLAEVTERNFRNKKVRS
jgi:hypothetical protein